MDNATLHAGFCLGVGEHERFVTTAKFRRNTVIPCILLKYFDCRSRSNRPCAAKVQNHVCWMVGKISMELPPSVQCELLCKTTQQLKSRNRQSNGWKTSRLIPRRGHILLHCHWVFLRLKIRIEDKFLPCFFLFWSFPLPLFWR